MDDYLLTSLMINASMGEYQACMGETASEKVGVPEPGETGSGSMTYRGFSSFFLFPFFGEG